MKHTGATTGVRDVGWAESSVVYNPDSVGPPGLLGFAILFGAAAALLTLIVVFGIYAARDIYLTRQGRAPSTSLRTALISNFLVPLAVGVSVGCYLAGR